MHPDGGPAPTWKRATDLVGQEDRLHQGRSYAPPEYAVPRVAPSNAVSDFTLSLIASQPKASEED